MAGARGQIAIRLQICGTAESGNLRYAGAGVAFNARLRFNAGIP
jgi:hypothetical protein